MKIAAICTAPNQNTGMMFVDRALYLFLTKSGLHEATTYFSFQMEGINKVGFEYLPLTKDVDLKKFDCILIWGDFLISKHFLNMMKPKIARTSELLNYDLLPKVLMAELSDLELKKVIVFGQCIFIDERSVFSDKDYELNITRLLTNAGLVRVRDPLSAYRAKLLANCNRDFLGIDAALLNATLDKVRIKEIRNAIDLKSENTIGLFFARSKKMQLKKKVLGYYLKFKLKYFAFKWIPWLENKQESKEYFKYAKTNKLYSDLDYIKEILKCNIIITDTYHLSLMSWSLGIPCICFGNSAEQFKLTTHDKKKEIFFISNFISDYYFYNESFYSDLKNGILLDKIIEGIDSDIGKKIANKISLIAKMNIQSLNDHLETLK